RLRERHRNYGARLVTMPCGGKHTRKGKRCLGVQKHTHARFACLREPRSRRVDRRNHGMASPHARADRDRHRIRGTKSRPAGSTRVGHCFPGTCSFCLITARRRLCDTPSSPIRSSKLWSADGKCSRMEPCFKRRKPRAFKFLLRPTKTSATNKT